jgi:hypothetical protein
MRMLIFTFASYLHKLHTYSWRAHNSTAALCPTGPECETRYDDLTILRELDILIFFSKIMQKSWFNIGFFLLKGPVADATDAPQPWRLIVQPYEEDDEDDDGEVFSAFTF